MRLHSYAASGNAYKTRLLVAQLGLDVELVEVDLFAGDTLTDAFAALSPSRTVPVLELDDGRALPESAAIMWLLADGTPLLPADPWTRASVLRWLVWEQTDFLPGIGGLRFRLQTGRLTAGEPAAVARRKDGAAALSLLDDHLGDRPFLTGEACTIADIAVYGYGHVANEAGFDLGEFPAYAAWLDRVASQPGHINDLAPYPPNARPGAGASIYG